ncbi:MAG: glycerol kinase GlpK [Sphaerochaetaceae bacterium]
MHYIGALDQGTTSTRFFIFDESGNRIASSQKEHKQYFPQPGWVEHNPNEIWERTKSVIKEALATSRLKANQISAIGITNQRESVLAWEAESGVIRHNVIVWQDLRGSKLINTLKDKYGSDFFHQRSGLVASPYFAASKIAWMLENDPQLALDASNGKVVIGTIDSFLVYKLTGNLEVVTDVTNASRYMLMNIETLKWDEKLLEAFNIPIKALPKIVNSYGEIYGHTQKSGPLKEEIPVCGILGDQQAALFGQVCFTKGQSKSTYGTGGFLLTNIGQTLKHSKNGLLTTVAFKGKGEKPFYAFEGSIAVAGSLVQWARDNLKIVKSAPELDQIAQTVEDNGGVYIVPAFSGLFAPYWRSDARGVIVGLTGYVTNAHICRAILEATAFQVKDIVDAMIEDGDFELRELKVDGGMTNSNPLMKFQADLLNIPVIKPKVFETTALGAAYAAGLSVGIWSTFEQLEKQWQEQERYTPTMGKSQRDKQVKLWNKAIERTYDWVEE